MRNKVLKTVTATTAILGVVSMCAIDSESNIPLIICGMCIAWILLFVLANRKDL